MTRYLVTGAAGMLGTDIVAALAGRDVTALARTDLDITDAAAVAHAVEGFDVVINTAAYTRVDAALFLDLAPGVAAQVNVENLLGETYFPTAHNDNNITTGAPRNVRATLRLGF